MQNLLFSILKNKKIVVAILLFFVLLEIALPQINAVRAQYGGGIGGGVGAMPESPNKAAAIAVFAANAADKCENNLTWYQGIAAGIADILVWVPYTLADWATSLSSWVISTVLGWPITKAENTPGGGSSQAFINGWTAVRDLANMLIVLGFVIIGIATTLRIQDYQAKKLLLPLILIALLVNFSNVFVGLFIDASNITMTSLLHGRTNSTMGITFIQDVINVEGTLACKALTEGNLGEYVTIEAEFGFIYVAIAISFLYLAFMLIARYAVLGILFMLSPIAFISWVFPASKKLWNSWWENFIKWVFIGVGISFFLNLAGQLLATFPSLTGPTTANPSATAPSLSTVFFYLLIVLITLVVGIKITTKSSAIGAAAVMGLAGGAVGLAMGVAGKAGMGTLKGLGKGADAATGGRLSGAGQKISSGVGRTMEALGFRKAGATAQSRAKELGESENRYSSLVAQGDLARVQRIAKGEGVRVTPKERAGAVAALLKSKNFDPNDAKQVAGLNYFQNQGGNLGEYSAKDPQLAKHDISATRNTMQKINPVTPGKNYTEADAKSHNVDTNYSRLGVRGMRDLPANAMNLSYLRNVSAIKNDKAAEEFSVEQIAQQKKYVTPGTKENAQYRKEQADLATQAAAHRASGKMDLAKELEDQRNRLIRNGVKIFKW